MAVIQSIKGRWKTFGEFADSLLSNLITLSQKYNSTRLDFVVDRYSLLSVKNKERQRRGEKGVQKVYIFGKHRSVPKQWKKFSSCGKNKESLLSFLCEHWRSCKSSQLSSISTMYVTAKERFYVLYPGATPNDIVTSNEVFLLRSNNEEADTCLLLHANHAAATYDKVIIKSPDTYVLILTIVIQPQRQKKIFLTGTGHRCRCIPVSTITNYLGADVSRCLSGFHAFTGNPIK